MDDSQAHREAPQDVAVAVLYEELRELAHRYRSREGAGATLHTTELVHEAWLRLGDDVRVAARGRSYFFGAAAQAMRRVLVDAARRRSAAKRGGDFARVTLGPEQVAVDGYASDLLDLDRALSLLDREHPRLARVVELRFFGGLTVEETAAALEVSPRTVKGDWALARAWLHDTLDGGGAPREG
ncbi:MAG: sigma-70 family RNA polymerase sigma factor [Gemmatimonadales bacterium]|nr:MAG: sigma-70 family RNA polymerase sigma factor [Gemmatimonadales bacterium]